MKSAVLQNRWMLGLANRDLQLHVGMGLGGTGVLSVAVSKKESLNNNGIAPPAPTWGKTAKIRRN